MIQKLLFVLLLFCFTTLSVAQVANPPAPYHLCDISNPGDGMEVFDLETVITPQVLGTQPAIDFTVTYFLTQSDANQNQGSIVNTSNYINTGNPQTLFIRVEENSSGNFNTTTVTLIVDPLPQVVPPTDLEACSIQPGVAVFNLNSKIGEITNNNSDYYVTFYETEVNAINQVGALVGESYTNIIAYQFTLWISVEDTITGCSTITSMLCKVLDSPEFYLDNTYTICNNTPVIDTELSATGNFTFEWYFNGISTGDTTPSIIPTQVGEYSVIVSDVVNGCSTTRTTQVIDGLILSVPNPLYQCDDLDNNYYANNDGETTFDLTVKDVEITGGNSNLIVSYYETQTAAEAGSPTVIDATAYTNTSNPQTIFVRVEDFNTGCYGTTFFSLFVRPNPSPGPNPNNLELCDENNPGDEIEAFDLTVNETYIINGEPNLSLSYYTNLNDALAEVNPIANPTMQKRHERPMDR